jgi:hypothetical protein
MTDRVTTSFSGISDPTNWPPENGLAAGPANVVMVESSKIEWTNLTGGAAVNESLYTLFASLGASQRNSLLDDRVAYDSVNNRFVVMAEDLGSNESNIDIAVSKDSNPNDGWYVGSINTVLTANGVPTAFDMPWRVARCGISRRAQAVQRTIAGESNGGPDDQHCG